MEWSLKKHEELKLSELYELLKLRASVFVVEQDCPYLDLDGKDSLATHILGYQRNKLVAYSRVFRPGSFEKKHARIGRIVVQKKSRRKNMRDSDAAAARRVQVVYTCYTAQQQL